VRLIAHLFGYSNRRADAVMQQVGITPIAKRRTQACSGGEKQRLKFAMALVCEPDLMILDEPTAGMDVAARRDFWADVHTQALAGRTIVFATHYLEEADQYADRIVMMVNGRVVADGTTAEVRNMVSGRIITADFDSPKAAQDAAKTVAHLSRSVEVQGVQVTARSQDSDAILKLWLTSTTARDVLVASQGLEDAFLSLSGNQVTK